MANPALPEHHFGAYRFDASKRLLYRDGDLLSLSPKALDVLAVLLEDRGEVVSKSDLLRRAWPGTTVEEIGLARNISLLRKELGDWIETIPKKGYRFAAAHPPAAPPPSQRPRRLLVVLLVFPAALAWIYWQFFIPSEYLPPGKVALAVSRLDALGGAPTETEAEAVREALVTGLAKFEGVHVVSPSTVKRYEKIRVPASWMARVLGLEVLVEGAVTGAGKLTLRIVDVHTGRVIAADQSVDGFLAAARKSLKIK